MMLRTMCCKKALASKSKRQYAPRRLMSSPRKVFTGVRDWQPAARKLLKSCSPSRCSAALCMDTPSSGLKTQPHKPASSAGRTGDWSTTKR